ncbi:scyllo-inositol 2-dehydrogenase (NADP(+)) IolU [bioreactor metagenome]|uniref:Scyllo-inositol 2-dehydrogenase (NADP(+)) IolU n=1 Tax=bioreactor metagenome TaxID=1076179 RepID=A0A645BAT0_9ZZZZ|nr:Gfo/Idh/MocA family oxidoreductase [Christensenella sp.]
MKTPLRIGIIGTSFVSDWLCEAARMSEDCSVSAVYSRDFTHGSAYAKERCIECCYCEETAFLTSSEIDAVYIASPNIAHYRQALGALECGKHVLCEKPLALNAAQAERMLQTAQAKKLVLLEAIRPIYDPFLQTLKNSLRKVGRIRRATIEFCQYSSRYDRFLAGEQVNIFDASLGNAALLDLGVYCLHLCVALFGMPKTFTAASSFLPNGTEAAGTILLDYGDQQTTVSYSKVTISVEPSMIQGELGTLMFDAPNQPSYIKMLYRDHREEILYQSRTNNMVFELNAFSRLINGGGSTAEFDAQSLNVMRLMDAARRQTGIQFGEGEML